VIWVQELKARLWRRANIGWRKTFRLSLLLTQQQDIKGA